MFWTRTCPGSQWHLGSKQNKWKKFWSKSLCWNLQFLLQNQSMRTYPKCISQWNRERFERQIEGLKFFLSEDQNFGITYQITYQNTFPVFLFMFMPTYTKTSVTKLKWSACNDFCYLSWPSNEGSTNSTWQRVIKLLYLGEIRGLKGFQFPKVGPSKFLKLIALSRWSTQFGPKVNARIFLNWAATMLNIAFYIEIHFRHFI